MKFLLSSARGTSDVCKDNKTIYESLGFRFNEYKIIHSPVIEINTLEDLINLQRCVQYELVINTDILPGERYIEGTYRANEITIYDDCLD